MRVRGADSPRWFLDDFLLRWVDSQRDIELDMIIAGHAPGFDHGKGGCGAIELSLLSVTF
jgi:hypothetical protein